MWQLHALFDLSSSRSYSCKVQCVLCFYEMSSSKMKQMNKQVNEVGSVYSVYASSVDDSLYQLGGRCAAWRNNLQQHH